VGILSDETRVIKSGLYKSKAALFPITGQSTDANLLKHDTSRVLDLTVSGVRADNFYSSQEQCRVMKYKQGQPGSSSQHSDDQGGKHFLLTCPNDTSWIKLPPRTGGTTAENGLFMMTQELSSVLLS